jgi:hypothetical protein
MIAAMRAIIGRVSLVTAFLLGCTVGAVGQQDANPSSQASRPVPGFRVRILGPDKQPLAGAVVDVAEVTPWVDVCSPVRPDYFTSSGSPDRVRAMGMTTDERGEVPLSTIRYFARVRARYRDLAVEDWFSAPPPGMVIRLQLRPVVLVLVVDEAGKPQANVPVLVANFIGHGFGDRHCAITGEDGVARVAPPDLPRPTNADLPRDWRAGLALPLAQPVELPVGADSSREPIKLVLPSTGTLTVKVTHPDGSPYKGLARVRLKRRMESSERDYEDTGDHGVVGAEVGTTSGEAVFPRVGLNQEFFIRVGFGDESLRLVAAIVRGPTQKGEHAVGQIASAGPALRLTGRLSPRRDWTLQDVYARLLTRPPPTAIEYRRDHDPFIARGCADPKGRFTLRFEIDPKTVSTDTVRLWGSLIDMSDEHGATDTRPSPTKGIDVKLPASIRSGLWDLGEISFP